MQSAIRTKIIKKLENPFHFLLICPLGDNLLLKIQNSLINFDHFYKLF